MTEQCYYIGIDMDDRNAVISYYKAGMREPETLSTIAGSEIYQIPVALIKKRGIGQWFIGEEAKKMALIQNEDVIGHLLDNALAKKQVTVENIVYEAEELFALYIKKLLLLASRLGNPGLPDCLVITVEALSRELTELFGKVAEDLGLGRSQLILQDRKESFYYFVYNQKQELWLHDIFLFDCRGDEVTCPTAAGALPEQPAEAHHRHHWRLLRHLRRPEGGRQLQHHHRPHGDRGADRPKRGRKDHGVQPADEGVSAYGGRHFAGRQGYPRHDHGAGEPGGHRPDVPEHPAFQRSDGGGKPDGGHGRLCALWAGGQHPALPPVRPGGADRPGAGGGAAEYLSHGAPRR